MFSYLRESQEEQLVGRVSGQAGQRGVSCGGSAPHVQAVRRQRRAQPAVVRDVLALSVEPVHLTKGNTATVMG